MTPLKKAIWDKEWLKGISAFATFNGGTYLIGVNDDGEAVGIVNAKDVMKSISDTIRNVLGISPDIECVKIDDKDVIRITVYHSKIPVDCNGKFYKRIGNTVHEMRGTELTRLLLERSNMTWTDQELDHYRMENLSNEALEYVFAKGKGCGNIPKDAECDLPSVLDNFDLRGTNGTMTIAAAALFSKKPNMYAPGTYIKIGRFDQSGELVGEDVVEGPLIMQPELAVEILFKKYIRNRYSYGDLFREVKFEYSQTALREAVLNACIHKDYLRGNPVFIKVILDRIEIFNEGSLPESWTYDDFVSEDHTSLPPNKKIANVFHKIGMIEHWGRGVRLMIEECKKDGSKPPEFVVNRHGITVKFFNSLIESDGLQSMTSVEGLDEYEQRIYVAISSGNMMKISDIVNATNIAERTVYRILDLLKKKQMIERVGTNRQGRWIIIKNK